MAYQDVIYEAADGIATITLNRPDLMNAMSLLMAGEIRAAVQQASDDDAVAVIILTGAGRGFCAGADAARLTRNASGQPREQEPLPSAGAIAGGLDLGPGFAAKYAYLPTTPKPVLAAVNGAAVGVGMVLALFADIRFASTKARFSSAFAKRGLVPEYGIAWILPRLVGPSKAMDILLSARLVESEEAYRIGLVDRLLEPEALLETTRAYACELIGQVSPRSTRIVKEMVYRGLDQDFAAAVDLAVTETRAAGQCNDFKEGIAAWQEKRPPRFTGT